MTIVIVLICFSKKFYRVACSLCERSITLPTLSNDIKLALIYIIYLYNNSEHYLK